MKHATRLDVVVILDNDKSSINVAHCLEFVSPAPGPFSLLITIQGIVRVSVNYLTLTYVRVVANLDTRIRRSQILARTMTGKS